MVLGVIGAAAVWLSFPSVFVIGGVGFTLIASDLLEGRRREAVAWVASMSVCSVSFGLAYLLSFRYYAKNDNLSTWWTYAFAPMPPRSMGDVKWYIDNFFLLFPSEAGTPRPGLCGALLLFGMHSLWRDPARRCGRAAFPGPDDLNAHCFGLRKYPFGDRTMLFSNPLLATLVAAGVAAVWEVRQPTMKVFVAIIVGTMLLYPLYLDAKYMIDPQSRIFMDVKPTLVYVADHRKDGNVLYVHWDAETLYDYYVKKRDFRNLKDWQSVISRHPGKRQSTGQDRGLCQGCCALRVESTGMGPSGNCGPTGRGCHAETLGPAWSQTRRVPWNRSAAYLYEFGPEGAGGVSHESIGRE